MGCERLAGYRLSVSYLSQAAGRIKRALRQEARLQATHVAECQERERLRFTDGFYPESLQRLSDQFADEVYFMILAAKQAVSARDVVVSEGLDLPPIRQEQGIVAWRDVLEHWDDPPLRGKDIRALRRWEDFNQGTSPGGGWSSVMSEDGATHTLLEISGVKLDWLRRDLEAVLPAVDHHLDELFEERWLDPDAAAAYLGLKRVPETSPYPGIWYMDWPHKGRRYDRDGLDQWLRLRAQVEGS